MARPKKIVLINESDVDDNDILQAMQASPALAAMTTWTRNVQRGSRSGGIFERDRYVTPGVLFDQFRVALDAVESDDVCSGALETTESLMFTSLEVVCDDEDEENVWNQIIYDIELEIRFREMWRELFTVSQYYAAMLWTKKDYKVQGETDAGNQKKKQYPGLNVPSALTLLDPLKVLPVGNFLFGQERLAYLASPDESLSFQNVLAGDVTSDLIVASLLERKMDKDEYNAQQLSEETGAVFHDLYLMNKDTVFRHTATRPSYAKFASVRMKSVFELLDLKQQLRQMDRVHLTAATNFILLIKKGEKDSPAQQPELAALNEQVRTLARVPIIVGDHRLNIEIITPKVDATLQPERYNNLDSRITSRLFQMFSTGSYSSGTKGDDSIKLARILARGMESRRTGMIASIMKNIILPTMARNPQLKSPPELNVTPKRIALDFDPQVLNYILEARTRGDISRETALGEMEIDQLDEVRNRKREKKYDKIFEPPALPTAPIPPGGAVPAKPRTSATPKAGGRKGGTNPNSFTSGPGRGPAKPG